MTIGIAIIAQGSGLGRWRVGGVATSSSPSSSGGPKRGGRSTAAAGVVLTVTTSSSVVSGGGSSTSRVSPTAIVLPQLTATARSAGRSSTVVPLAEPASVTV